MKSGISSLNPQIIFDGQCGDAIALYERILGAKAVRVVRYSEMQAGAPIPEDRRGWYAHATLQVGGGVLMVSDDVFHGRQSPMPGHAEGRGTVHLEFADPAELRKLFDALAAEGGHVIMKPHDTFWGAVYGALVDKFGVGWDFHHEQKKES